MKSIGIVCEYNPFHNGHFLQFRKIREQFGNDCAIVCAMSGNYVQRGAPAIFDKCIRARAAILSGADLVVELPVPVSLSSAEGFAAGGIDILSKICDTISFGTESLNSEQIHQTAETLLSEEYSIALKQELKKGTSFPTARQNALEAICGGISRHPNDILAVEYYKAILSHSYPLDIYPINRLGAYHSDVLNSTEPSASAIRRCILNNQDWSSAVPEEAALLYRNASVHTIEAGERAILYRLRTMRDSDFESLPYGSEGLWRRFMHACRTECNLEGIIEHTKTKRYTRTRIDRMIMCAFLGITEQTVLSPIPYSRILAFTDVGRMILNNSKNLGFFINTGIITDSPYWELEKCSTDLYGLFSVEAQAPGAESGYRIFYKKNPEMYRNCDR